MSQGCGQVPEGSRDCSEILGRMFFFLDNELDQAGCAEIQQHLDDCAPCLSQYEIERTVKAIVARSCAENAPDYLRQKVRVSIQQISLQIQTRPAD